MVCVIIICIVLLATLSLIPINIISYFIDSIIKNNEIDLIDVANNFTAWLDHGEFTPFGFSFDVGNGCAMGIKRYESTGNPNSGGASETNNGNGSLMRIMPACIYCATKIDDDKKAVELIESVSAITHAHKRAKMACGIYYFITKEILNTNYELFNCIQNGIDKAFAFYSKEEELSYYNRIRDVAKFMKTPVSAIKSTGYVVDTLEAAIWSLATTDSYKDALLKAVNLGDDTDTVGAVAGGLAGLFYGVPFDWIDTLQRKEWLIKMCACADRL